MQRLMLLMQHFGQGEVFETLNLQVDLFGALKSAVALAAACPFRTFLEFNVPF